MMTNLEIQEIQYTLWHPDWGYLVATPTDEMASMWCSDQSKAKQAPALEMHEIATDCWDHVAEKMEVRPANYEEELKK